MLPCWVRCLLSLLSLTDRTKVMQPKVAIFTFCVIAITMSTAIFEEIPLTKEEVLACSFEQWYPRLKRWSPPAKIIPLPADFFKFLEQPLIKLPNQEKVVEIESDSDSEDETPFEFSPEFMDFYRRVELTVADFQFPKLNWLAPKDARWINSNSLRCVTADDVLLLLKSSDHIADDLDAPFLEVKPPVTGGANSYSLVLKRWIDINPSQEFRIFVHDGKAVGASQRDLNHYPHLAAAKSELEPPLWRIAGQVAAQMPILSFVVDIYMAPNQEPSVIDINPFLRKTSPLLYTWHELLQPETPCELRLVDTTNVGRFKTMEYSELMVPLEVVGAAHDAELMAELAREWRRLEKQAK